MFYNCSVIIGLFLYNSTSLEKISRYYIQTYGRGYSMVEQEEHVDKSCFN